MRPPRSQQVKTRCKTRVDRVDPADPNIPDSQAHIHFGENEAALNQDGTWHDAGKPHPNITNKIAEWITKNGWNLPNDQEKDKMKWKEKGINKYPDIIISDCMITNIQEKGGEITVKFSEYGFFKKDSQSGKYFRTDSAQIVIEQCDIDSISIKEIRNQKLSEDLYFDTMYDIEPSIFLENISIAKWKFEIIEEFYSTGGALYIGKIREDENSFWCHVKLQFKNLVYFWNEVRYDRPF